MNLDDLFARLERIETMVASLMPVKARHPLGEAMTPLEAMKALGYSHRPTFMQAVRKERIPFIRINARRFVFEGAAIRAWIERKTQNVP